MIVCAKDGRVFPLYQPSDPALPAGSIADDEAGAHLTSASSVATSDGVRCEFFRPFLVDNAKVFDLNRKYDSFFLGFFSFHKFFRIFFSLFQFLTFWSYN